jgi:hypothetical protein
VVEKIDAAGNGQLAGRSRRARIALDLGQKQLFRSEIAAIIERTLQFR